MKKLYLVRHAKSSWEQVGIRDFERPLTSLGIKRSKKVIDYLLAQEVKIDLMISSPAVRTHETARLFANGLDYPIESIRLQMDVYEA
ncbi:MAG: histidine phosphatase family protein, partial [Bacteroidota bacterium]